MMEEMDGDGWDVCVREWECGQTGCWALNGRQPIRGLLILALTRDFPYFHKRAGTTEDGMTRELEAQYE